MANTQTQKQCAHTGCNCPVAEHENWCSPHCESAPVEVMCGCGHAQCVAGAPAERRQTV